MNKRLDFIDLAKGVCMLMLVAGPGHCGIPISIPGTANICMPLYFIVSGIFFSTYEGFGDFVRRKTNRLLVPFLFFYLTAYVIFYVVNCVFPGLIKTEATGIWDVFIQRQYFNGPIWFLICLFWINIFFYVINQFVLSETFKAFCVILICIIGVLLSNLNIFLPCEIDVAMTAMPFFYFGYLLKHTKFLVPNSWDRYNILIALLLLGGSICLERYCDVGHIGFHSNEYRGIFIFDVVHSIFSVLALLLICKKVKHLPIVSYCGRYSIILLCTHHMYYRPLMVLFSELPPSYSKYLIFVLTVVLCILSIPFCKKYIPQFCALKDLITQHHSRL